MFYGIKCKQNSVYYIVTFVSQAIIQTFRFNGHLKDHQTHLNSRSRSLPSVLSVRIGLPNGECLPIERVLRESIKHRIAPTKHLILVVGLCDVAGQTGKERCVLITPDTTL